jgi:hypothetical protein
MTGCAPSDVGKVNTGVAFYWKIAWTLISVGMSIVKTA